MTVLRSAGAAIYGTHRLRILSELGRRHAEFVYRH